MLESKFYLGSLSDLYKLRRLNKLSHVYMPIDRRCFGGNLILYAVKFGLWALCEGGVLVIKCFNFHSSINNVSKGVSFETLLSSIALATNELGSIKDVDFSSFSITLIKKAKSYDELRWSAGVMYSGRSAELGAINRCLEGLLLQPEFSKAGEIVVCGPSSANHGIIQHKTIRYLNYDEIDVSKRFLIGKKKNYLIKNLRNEKLLITHARNVLNVHAIRNLPESFDLITPRSFIKCSSGKLPYLDLNFIKLKNLSNISGKTIPIYYDRNRWLDYIKKNFVGFIDGGLFCVRRSLALRHQLLDEIAWGEAEDVEWCRRLLVNGYISEVCLDSAFESTTCKTPLYEKYGHLSSYRCLREIYSSII